MPFLHRTKIMGANARCVVPFSNPERACPIGLPIGRWFVSKSTERSRKLWNDKNLNSATTFHELVSKSRGGPHPGGVLMPSPSVASMSKLCQTMGRVKMGAICSMTVPFWKMRTLPDDWLTARAMALVFLLMAAAAQ